MVSVAVSLARFPKTGDGTNSPNLAIAGSRVGEASLCRSMPSKTSVNFPAEGNISCRSTTNALMLSHLPPAVYSVPSPSCSWMQAFLTAEIVRSSRWRVVIHSCDRVIAKGASRDPKTALIAVLLPVALVP